MELDTLTAMFKEHCTQNDKQFETINKSMDLIANNHIKHLDDKVENLDKKLGVVANDVTWMKKFFWIVASASVGGLVAGVMNLLF
jgi:hypothetical protein